MGRSATIARTTFELPTASERAAESKMAHKWARRLHNAAPPKEGIPDKKSKCEGMMRMAEGTLRDENYAISSHFPGVRGGFLGKIVRDGNPSTLRCPNPS